MPHAPPFSGRLECSPLSRGDLLSGTRDRYGTSSLVGAAFAGDVNGRVPGGHAGYNAVVHAGGASGIAGKGQLAVVRLHGGAVRHDVLHGDGRLALHGHGHAAAHHGQALNAVAGGGKGHVGHVGQHGEGAVRAGARSGGFLVGERGAGQGRGRIFRLIAVGAGVSAELHPGNNVLIKGVSGSGKSTLLRAISGIWPFVDGKIFLPERDKLMFIPQKSYLPLGTLRAALNYPGNKPIDDTELIYLMDLCQIGYLKDKLDLEADWSHVLSVGEQQRLAFVRAHIQQPQWLFLDEATSALDEDTEANMYSLLQERLQQTTVVSVGHRSTLNKYHELVLRLNKSTRQVTLEKL